MIHILGFVKHKTITTFQIIMLSFINPYATSVRLSIIKSRDAHINHFNIIIFEPNV